MERKHRAISLLLLLGMAVWLITACSQSSPLYPINTWDDANCLLTVGRVMNAGKTLYREIYEQKGPTLYAIHALAARIQDTSFFGVYLLEVLAAFLTLLSGYAILERMEGCRCSLAFAAFFGALVYASPAFSRGDSAEEFCLPCLMGMLYLTEVICAKDNCLAALPLNGKSIQTSGTGKKRGDEHLLVCLGTLSGLVATMKYTMLGIPLGICLRLAIERRREGMPGILRTALWFLLGMSIPILFWVLYFASRGALGDFYRSYIYNNIFLYAGDSLTLPELARLLFKNLPWLLLVLIFCLSAVRKREARKLLPCLVQGAVLLFGGRMWPYTLLAMTPFALCGIDELAPCGNSRKAGRILSGLAVPALLLAAVLTPNAFLRFKKLERTAQGHLTELIEPGATFLQYSHLDDGMYLTTGTLPQEKYFCMLNVELDEMHEELDRYLEEGIPDYVLITWRQLPEQFTNYRQVGYAIGYDESNRQKKDFFLYKRTGP